MRFGFALAAATLLLVGTLTYMSVLRFREDAGMVDHTHRVLNGLAELSTSLTSAESAQRGHVGKVSNELLQTEFPQPLGEIEKILNDQGT